MSEPTALTGVELIGKHINLLDESLAVDVQTRCAFTGKAITRGIALKNVISSNFTDHAYIRYPTGYCCVDVAKCMQVLEPGGRASLRNYSFLATNDNLELLNRDTLFDVLLSEKQTPFVLAVTYNGKKHISYKTRPQYNNKKYTVFTDLGEVDVNMRHVNEFLPVIQSWYTVVRGKEATAAQPTYFTKDEILSGDVPRHKIEAYGIDAFFKETAMLEKYRGLPLLKLFIHTLKKQSADD